MQLKEDFISSHFLVKKHHLMKRYIVVRIKFIKFNLSQTIYVLCLGPYVFGKILLNTGKVVYFGSLVSKYDLLDARPSPV